MDFWVDEICKSSVFAANSNCCVSIDNVPPSYFKKFVALPTENSGSLLLFANQKPDVVSVTEVLPVLIYPCVFEPTISTLFAECAPTLILLFTPSSNILPSPNDIDALVELISRLVASNSKVFGVILILPLESC